MGARPEPEALSPELRAAEAEIDALYQDNPLLDLPYAVAAWHLLTAAEDSVVLPHIFNRREPQDHRGFNDNLINALRHPLRWLARHCPAGGETPREWNREAYGHAASLLNLAFDYDTAVGIFTGGTIGTTDLTLDGQTIRATNHHEFDLRYAAYDLLAPDESYVPDGELFEAFDRELRRAVTIRGDRFDVDLRRGLVHRGMALMQPSLASTLVLPDDWVFPNYSLRDFRRVAIACMAIGLVRLRARYAAATGMRGAGVHDCLSVLTLFDLRYVLHHVTGVARPAIAAIVSDLTLGNRGIRQLDPALQPIIPLGNDDTVLAPQLWMNVAVERNLIALLNKLPEERAHYLALVGGKEDVMRDELARAATDRGLRPVHGRVIDRADLPDADLILVDDQARLALLCELKWFVDPAEPREVVAKSEEIRKGVRQVKLLLEAAATTPHEFARSFNFETGYGVVGAVVSKGSIGTAHVQDADVPVIRLDHLIRKLAGTPLESVVEWLTTRAYLPIPEIHFSARDIQVPIGRWTIEHRGFVPLVKAGDFDP